MTYALIVWIAGLSGAILVPNQDICMEVGRQLAVTNTGLRFICVPLLGEASGTS